MGLLRKMGKRYMEHFEENTTIKQSLDEKRLSEKERVIALKNVNQECFFEYDVLRDILWLSRDAFFGEFKETEIVHFTERLCRMKRVCEEDVEGLIAYLRKADKEKCEFRYVKDDGSYFWCEARGSLIRDEEGHPKALVGCLVDVDQEKRMHQILIEQAWLDPLTKLLCKTKAQNLIEQYLRTEGSFGRHCLMIIDLCGFREVNKHYGNVFGDSVLANVGEQLQKCFRKKDVIARIGGDDFLVLLKDVKHQDIMERKAKQIIDAIQNVYCGEELFLSCNIGISSFPEDGRNFGSLFRHADAALYQSRKLGCNNFAVYDSSGQFDEFNKRGEFYHEYIIQEGKKQNEGDFKQEITNFAVDIMLDSKDVASAIKALLDKVGKYYGCDNVMILEVDDNGILHTTYSWNDKDGLNYFSSLQFIDMVDMPSMRDYFDDRGLRIISDTNTMRRHPGYAPMVNIMNAKALLQCAFYDEGSFKGCVCIGHEKKTHEWLKEEVEALMTITKLLSVYLLKLKASEKIQNRIEYFMNYDKLTKLSTEYKFKNDVMEELAQNPDRVYAVVYMDINKFKYMNDALGYEAGDELLCEVANTVASGCNDIISAGRVSSDNFVLLMNYVSDDQIRSNMKQLNDCFVKKITFCSLGRSVYFVSGVAKIRHGQDIVAAIDNANVARKSIKKSNEETCCFYDEKLEQQVMLEMDICNSMQQALENDEFVMYLQPKVDLEDDHIVGAEALTRWIRRDGRMMYPDQFIPLFEKNGFIVQLDFYIYEQACKAIRSWIDNNIRPVAVSVNVSRVHLNMENFVERVIALVEKYQVPRSCLEFELTESIFLDDTDVAISTMKRLREEGFSVSIDDFGAGYSSLNLLKDMATDVLKLDKEFFRKGDMKQEEKIIVASIINMAKQLKMKVLSEGVETRAQSDFLRGIACDMAQGYLFAKPMTEQEFTKLLKKRNPPMCD